LAGGAWRRQGGAEQECQNEYGPNGHASSQQQNSARA
jgi:hypothetical protein